MTDWGVPNMPQAESIGSQGAARKVAIPRLPKPELDTKSSYSKDISSKEAKNRVSHACEPCRQRKTKCSGERPVCRHCEDFRIACYYGDGKRDRAKNEMLNLQNKVENYERLLEQLSVQVDEPTQHVIHEAIGKKVRPTPSRQQTSTSSILGAGGEIMVGGDTGSIGSNDHVGDEAFLPPSSKNVGYLGKSSEVMWLMKAAQDLSEGQRKEAEERRDRLDKPHFSGIAQDDNIMTDSLALETPTYHMDDIDISICGDQVDPYGLPLKEVSDGLLKYYFETVHPLFPILLRELFMVQYESFYKFPFTPASSKRWLAILNAALAIGAVYSHMLGEETAGDDRDHMLYFTRARMLSLDGGVVYDIADLQQVQVAGLMGMYLLATSQTNRAWNITGLAIRYAQTLGLHLRTESNFVSESEKEMRARIWYAIQNLEQILSVSTGRPSAIQQRDCTAPMPKALDDEVIMFEDEIEPLSIPATDTPSVDVESSRDRDSPSQSGSSGFSTSQGSALRTPTTLAVTPPPVVLFYTEYAKLARIAIDALNSLYCPETMNMSWFSVQGKINDLDKALTQWRSELPIILDFGKRYRDQSLVRQRMTLMLQYNHTRIIINRPCLCRMDGRIPNESARSKQFNRNAAIICLESARDTINLLPDVPNPAGLYVITPWWCLPHYLVSAASVIIVEIAMKAEHNPGQANGMFADAKRVIDWLHIMGKTNASALQAAGTLSKLLQAAAPKICQTYPTELPNTSSPMTGIEGQYVTSRILKPLEQPPPPHGPVRSQFERHNSAHQAVQGKFGAGEGGSSTNVSRISPVDDQNFLTVYDQLPTTWTEQTSFEPSEFSNTSMMFPTPQQMHGIDIQEHQASLSRRQSLLARQQPPAQTGYGSQWNALDAMPLAQSPYPPALANSNEGAFLDNVEVATSAPLQTGDIEGDGSRRSSKDAVDGAPGPAGTAAAYHKQIREDIIRRHSQASVAQPGPTRKRRESPQ